jgi:hypothetical protein
MPISTYPELLAFLKSLPPVPPGCIRVYRGQTKPYPPMPVGLRHSLAREVVWQVYSNHLTTKYLADAAGKVGDLSPGMIQRISIWLQAVAQHYGPGSDFLDVTHSLEIALWFALNDSTEMKAVSSTGSLTPEDLKAGNFMEIDEVGYEPWTEAGNLFIYDLPKWSGDIPQLGSIVDLADAPPEFSNCTRMRVQSGCLVYCRGPQGPATPQPVATVQISPPMTGAPGIDRGVAEIIPSPSRDEWYSRLLSVPMTVSPTPAPACLRRSIPVVVYHDAKNPAYNEEVHRCDVMLTVPLIHRSIRDFGRPGPAPDPNPNAVRDAVAILLEAPMVFPTAPGDSDQWNQELLLQNLPDRCAVRGFDDKAAESEVSLANVFFEFSLLEYSDWDDAIRKKQEIRLLRGVYLRRVGSQINVAWVYQTIPGSTAPEVVGFLPIRYDSGQRQLVFGAPDSPVKSLPISADPDMAKYLFVALMILRNLSSQTILDPTPIQFLKKLHSTTTFLYSRSCGGAKLYRVPGTPKFKDFFVARSPANKEEPFTRARPTGFYKLETELAFRDIPSENLV